MGIYRKLHPAIRRSIYSPGADTPVFRIGALTFGILICRDSTFPAAARIMASRGATALFIPTNNGLPPDRFGPEIVDQSRQTDIARAKENGVWIIRSDVAGKLDGLVSYGSSSIVSSNGRVAHAATQLESGLLIAEID
jgi:predicted amidohydrolase